MRVLCAQIPLPPLQKELSASSMVSILLKLQLPITTEHVSWGRGFVFYCREASGVFSRELIRENMFQTNTS